jgi:hypothetical protein
MLRKYEWNIQDIWDIMKRPKLWIIGVEEGEEIQTKGIDNLFSRIIAEKFPNIEKERVTQMQEAYRIPSHKDQKRNTHQTHNQNTQHTERGKNTGKKKDKSHIKKTH